MPVGFMGLAEHDIAGPSHDIPRDFPSSRDVTLFLLSGAGHNSNVAPNRHELWNRMHGWARSVLTTTPWTLEAEGLTPK